MQDLNEFSSTETLNLNPNIEVNPDPHIRHQYGCRPTIHDREYQGEFAGAFQHYSI